MPNDKTTFVIPDTTLEPPLFLGLMYAATRSEDEFEHPEKGGPGRPLYSAYICPYTADDVTKEKAKTEGAELPLFVSYIFPYLSPNSVVLGGGPGGRSALGGAGSQILFLGQVFSFIPAEPETEVPSSPPA